MLNKKHLKTRSIKMRCSEVFLRKLTAICNVTGKTKTSLIEELVYEKFKTDSRFEDRYYADLEKKI